MAVAPALRTTVTVRCVQVAADIERGVCLPASRVCVCVCGFPRSRWNSVSVVAASKSWSRARVVV